MTLLKEILEHKYDCKFITSTYAFAELGQSARDARTAVKIIRDGLSLNWFNRLKKRYPLKRKEQTDIIRSIESFHSFLEKNGVEILELVIAQQDINKISLRHCLEVHDATHLVMARKKANYLITVDPDFLECRPKIRKPEVMRPPTLATKPELRNKKC
jgi:predicted nucleic acid-binding protein